MSDEVQEIKDRLDLVEFIGQYVELKQTGKNWRGLCPFHQERTPSFFVNPERQFYHCFGCDRSGDIYNFLMEREGLEFYEALKILAQRAGVELKTRPGQQQRREKRNRLIQAHDLANRLYRHLLERHPSGVGARQYLEKRSVTQSMIEQFELGYSPDSWETTGKSLLDRGFTPDELIASGLIIAKSTSKKPDGTILDPSGLEGQRHWYDRFRGRLMFPVHDHMGRVVGFSARSLDPEDETAKYINTPETPLFKKGKLLYGLYQAREAVRVRDYVVLVEGNLDVISLHQYGITNTVAPLGTSLTTDQINLIKRFTNRVLLCFDMDEAGEKATLRAIEASLQTGLEMKVAALTKAKDPDQAAQKDLEQLKQDLTAAKPVFEYLVKLGEEKFDLDETAGKRQFSEFILPFVARVEDAIERDDYVHRVAEILAVSEDSVRAELVKTEKRRQRTDFQGQQTDSPLTNQASQTSKTRAELISEYLISMLLQTPPTLFKDAQLIDLAEEIEEKYLPQEKRDLHWPILQALIDQLKNQTSFQHSTLNQQLNALQVKLLNLLALNNFGTIVETEDAFLQTFEETVWELKNLWLREEMNQVTQRIREAERDQDDEKVTQLKQEFSNLSAKLNK